MLDDNEAADLVAAFREAIDEQRRELAERAEVDACIAGLEAMEFNEGRERLRAAFRAAGVDLD